MLRRAGCVLPVEMWCFEEELPTAAMATQFAQMGVVMRSLDELQEGISRGAFHDGAQGFGFVMKAVVLLFSSFEEVLYLDTDNIAVTDPTDLFDSQGYLETGMVLWPDYWPASVAPDFYAIAREAKPLIGTVETGQMVVHKRRCWRGLQLALYINLQGNLYYNLLTNYMGVGDKETFPAAMRMVQQPFEYVRHPTGSAGRQVSAVIPGQSVALASLCMVQYHPDSGAPLFFHNNLAKFSMDVPSDFAFYKRLWQVMVPAGFRFSEHVHEEPALVPVLDVLGFDLERECWHQLMQLRCQTWLEGYSVVLRERAAQTGRDSRAWEHFELVHTDRGLDSGIVLDDHITGIYLAQRDVGKGQKEHDEESSTKPTTKGA